MKTTHHTTCVLDNIPLHIYFQQMVSKQTNNMLSRPIFHVESNGAIGGFSYPSCSNVFGCTSAWHHFMSLRGASHAFVIRTCVWHRPTIKVMTNK
eukprot:scaffold15522_cov92-Skeletonema_marinoi.AAC.2